MAMCVIFLCLFYLFLFWGITLLANGDIAVTYIRVFLKYCKTINVGMRFISGISRARQIVKLYIATLIDDLHVGKVWLTHQVCQMQYFTQVLLQVMHKFRV